MIDVPSEKGVKRLRAKKAVAAGSRRMGRTYCQRGRERKDGGGGLPFSRREICTCIEGCIEGALLSSEAGILVGGASSSRVELT
jgi:hypothetical protein